jgi:hypothetical protein
MKKSFGIVLLIFSVGLVGCASIARDAHYANLAKEHDFEYFFPSNSFRRTFATIDEAYDFVKTLNAKFSNSVDKPSAKGLAAKLTGPGVTSDNPVTVGCFMNASSGDSIDLSKIDKPLETVLREANAATIVFLIFYNDRAVSIPDYHLKQGRVFTQGNAQYKSFRFNGNTYETTYPVNWGTDKAFQYLKGERD